MSCYHLPSHKGIHCSVVFKFVFIKILLQRWKQITARWQVPLIRIISVDILLQIYNACKLIFWPPLLMPCKLIFWPPFLMQVLTPISDICIHVITWSSTGLWIIPPRTQTNGSLGCFLRLIVKYDEHNEWNGVSVFDSACIQSVLGPIHYPI